MSIQNQLQERRELGDDEDLEKAIDYDNEFGDSQLKSKILFSIQGLGGIKNVKRDGKQIQAYIKGPYCEQSVKDLVKYIRKETPDQPKVSLILSQYNIIESDLIKIFVLHVEDKILSFWLLALMASLTAKPSDNLSEIEKDTLNQALREYKKTFMKNQGITYLILHISDYVKMPREKILKAHIQIMDFIITLVRNLIQIRSQEVGSDQLHSHFLLAMFKEDMIGPLFFLLQTEKGELMQRIQIPLLQIFYHVFTCLDPTVLYQTKKLNLLKQQAMKSSNRKPDPVRHSRFMPNFSQTNQNGINRVVHTLEKKEEPLAGQRKVPNKRAELKKVQQIQREYIQQNFLEIQVDAQGDGNKRTMKQIIFQYAKQFVEVEFEHLSRLVFDNIYKETAKVSKQNIMQYLLLCSWELKMTRCKYQKGLLMAKTPQEKGAIEFDFSQILCIMQTGHFQLIYKLLFRQTTREKKKNFDINMFNAALILFLNYLQVIEDISVSFNMSDRKNANTLMANMFRHDIARIFKKGFHQIIHEKILKTLIQVTYKFFKLLSQYSQGKVLTIQTNKVLKSKAKGKKRIQQQNEQKQMQQFISHDQDESNQSDSYKEGDNEEKEKKKKQNVKDMQQLMQQIKFQQRKYNEQTQFAVIADYEIISKYLVFLKRQRFLENSKDLNTAIFFYFQRIFRLLKGQWLFFQAETLIIFNEILNSSQFAKQYPKARETIKQICASFIKLLKFNRLALVQSLFRCTNIQIKEQIFKNYSDQIDINNIPEVDHQFY